MIIACQKTARSVLENGDRYYQSRIPRQLSPGPQIADTY
jgi:hypothetical protein